MARICIAGEWHQAVVVGACLANMGHDVRGAIVDEQTAHQLRAGTPPVHEPELPQLMRRGLESGALQYTTSFEDALRKADYAFIAIDTPIADDDTPELDDIVAMARRIAGSLSGDIVLVVTAQVPVGTCERLRDLVSAGTRYRVNVAHVPEFLRLGHAVSTFMEADRFIIGCEDAGTADALAEVYAPLGRPILQMDLRSAEMAKHASNAFLAASISFTNEIADLCAEVGADIAAVTEGMKLDRRIGPHAFLGAGLGFAGGTLGRDLRALQELGRMHERATHVADAVIAVNRSRSGLVRHELERAYGTVDGLRVGVLGLTYKPGTSTLRRSIALEIIADLVAAGADVVAFDPLADMSEIADPPRFERVADPAAAAAGADALVLVTEWDGLDRVDLAELCARMRRPLFIDTRNHFDPATMAAHGFRYAGVGRGAAAERSPVAGAI
jgi:UDPglucose 6-dehydrogenase